MSKPIKCANIIEKVPGAMPKMLLKIGPKITEAENFIFVPKIGVSLTFVKIMKNAAKSIEKKDFAISNFLRFIVQI